MKSDNHPVELAVRLLPVVNYALQQNGAAPAQCISITNHTDAALEHVTLRITASPGFVLPYTRHIDCVPAGKTVAVENPKLLLDGEYLAGLSEKVTGLLCITLEREETVLAERHEEMTMLAFDQWHGIGYAPELLAAFVTPNHPEIAGLLRRASEILGKWTGDSALDAYQSQDPNRVVSQAAAIFTAIREQNIHYAVAPASFQETGQRVRLCDMVLDQKLGTCLDLTLLYAACLEAAGLFPLLIVTTGHIFAGVWTQERMFPECVQDDASLITKRLASGVSEIAVAETTLAAADRKAGFDDARFAAEMNLATQDLECIVDVRRARLSGVSPLPLRIRTDGGWVVQQDSALRREHSAAPRKLYDPIIPDQETGEEQLPRMAQWERKLLDLGMRNTLINLRLTRTQIPILTNSLDDLEDALSDGSDFSIMPRPADWQVGEYTFETLCQLGTSDIIRVEFRNRRLRSVLTQAELQKTIKELYRTARTALEENGANTLYLALGILRWFESDRSTRPRYAPIMLLPIEMVRRSAAQGYRVRLRDEEPQMNITLLEKLKQDFGIDVRGLDPLPADDHGIDIRRVLTVIRKAVMDQPRWDVAETATIGIFSFSQFVMWNDIRSRSDDLMRNKIVRSLMEGRLCWNAEPLEMGERVDEDNVLLPMAADASQLYAIRTACAGESFVLHGPPGTGKSQTITSLIAGALAQGKRVLFVAEKMAALAVVQKRLERIGIGAFCLELHSNKSRKKDVLEQLRQAAEVTKTTPAADYAARAERIADMRAQLDGYARQLHTRLKCGRDLYALIGEYESLKDVQELEPCGGAFLEGLDAEALEQCVQSLERLTAAGREVGHPHGHPLRPVTCTEYTQNLRMNLRSAAQGYREALERITPWAQQLPPMLGQQPVTCAEDLTSAAETARMLECWYGMPRAWAMTEFPQIYFEEVTAMAAHFQKAEALEQQLLGRFRPEFLDQRGDQLYAEYAETGEKWLLARVMGRSRLLNQVNTYAESPVEKGELGHWITALRDFQTERGAAKALLDRYGKELGEHYTGTGTDWAAIARLAEQARDSARWLHSRYGSYHFMHGNCGRPEIRDAVLGLAGEYGSVTAARENFEALLGTGGQREENWLAGQAELCRAVADHADELKEWIAWTAAAREAEALGLGNAVRAYEAGMDHNDLLPAWKKTLLQGLICRAIDESDTLNRFSGAVFNKKIEQYKRMDEEWTALSREEIYCRLASQVPNFTREAAQSSELGILQRCIKSGGRGVSIRRLFDQIPGLLPRLCPCMLMSPISAAQYLDPSREPFDIVVFDEASQLPTCKAVGVLARGKDAVIVGDPRQMPPTSFFATNTTDEDNLEEEDLESILDDCLALNMPQSHLLWHYRSRHESLIAFSNTRFYENKLYTFPSVNDRESKVRLIPVDGVFERGKARRNRAEAEAVVAELRRRSQDPALAGQSVGVVTFNISQQHLIDDLLGEACAKDPALEKWAFGSEEPVFIKNLENVQGDERDVILFSVGYGPDEQGKVSMNFGPLNRDGGWRRLNVAVSRARCEMVVFSTLKPEQIDLNRTRAEGVAALRGFLEYAEGRPMALDENSARLAGQSRDGVADAICAFLAEKGYRTDRAVGRSKFRVDIGVVDPADPDRYRLGIMLDGASYSQARTTRDREIAQQSVLEGLGWRILRVWTMDWWDNSAKECRRILAKLKEAPEKPAALPEPPKPEKKLEAVSAVAAAPAEFPVYRAAVLPQRVIPAESFGEPGYLGDIRKRIELVIREEAPVSVGLLTRRVVQSCGIARAGSRIQSCMNTILAGMDLRTTVQGDTVFCWRHDQDPEAFTGFRVNGTGEDKRDIRDVSVREIANAACTVLGEQGSMGREDLLRETARKLGYTRLGGNVLAALNLGLAYTVEKGRIACGENDTCTLN